MSLHVLESEHATMVNLNVTTIADATRKNKNVTKWTTVQMDLMKILIIAVFLNNVNLSIIDICNQTSIKHYTLIAIH